MILKQTLIQKPNWYVNAYGEDKNMTDDQKADMILNRVIHMSGLTKNLVMGRSRKREIVQWRQLAMWLMCTYTKLTPAAIGKKVGRFDRTTVMHHRDFVNDLLSVKDPQFMNLIKLYNR